MTAKTYKAPWGQSVWVVTTAASLLAIGLAYKGAYEFSQTAKADNLVYAALLPVVMLCCWFYAPRAYRVDAQKLHIVRTAGSKTIALHDIKSARIIEPRDVRYSLRTFGVGGLFGYFGSFWNRSFGNMKFYLTQRKNLILIETNQGNKFVISPDSMDLLGELKPAV